MSTLLLLIHTHTHETATTTTKIEEKKRFRNAFSVFFSLFFLDCVLKSYIISLLSRILRLHLRPYCLSISFSSLSPFFFCTLANKKLNEMDVHIYTSRCMCVHPFLYVFIIFCEISLFCPFCHLDRYQKYRKPHCHITRDVAPHLALGETVG